MDVNCEMILLNCEIEARSIHNKYAPRGTENTFQ
jgi:hypothetical protein